MIAAQRLIVILGPTASGKSALAIRLAEKLGGEIVCCDSTQVYRHFDIGTGKVPIEKRRGIPHHLLDIVEPDEVFTAGEYRRRATQVLSHISSAGKVPILTAGTGLYLRALLEGLADAPERSEELRSRLRDIASRRGADYLHRILKRLDPETASRIAPRDAQKVIRAVEVRLLAGKTVSELHRRARSGLEGYQVKKIGLSPPREALYAQIDRRVEEMFQAGWLDEARRLIERGIAAESKPFHFIGYSELRDLLSGKLSLQQALLRIQQATRQYAKRQITWFRREQNVLWLPIFGHDPEAIKQALNLLERPVQSVRTLGY
jgi:tRNA dimethylallyltransferase